MQIRVVKVSDTAYKFSTGDILPADARKIDVVLSEAGFQIDRVATPEDVGLGTTPDQKLLDDFYGD